jgi:DNA primase
VLWRADRITPATRCIHVAEGETAAISIIEAGCETPCEEIVVATPGASTWRDEWAHLFKGRDVVLWQDADAAGAKQTQVILASIGRLARSIEMIPTATEEAR